MVIVVSDGDNVEEVEEVVGIKVVTLFHSNFSYSVCSISRFPIFIVFVTKERKQLIKRAQWMNRFTLNSNLDV